MSKNYVPKTLTEFITESRSIPLKRKYGERPAITAGANAPIRNQVLSYVAESGSVSKIDLKKFIVGLREGGSTPAAANMFIKRNAKYFVTENKNGVTYFKLSDLGQRLVNQFVTSHEGNVSEAVKEARTKVSAIFKSRKRGNILNEDEETPEFEVPEDEEFEDMDNEGPAAEIGFDDDKEDFDLEQDEDDLENEDETIEELKDRVAKLEAQLAELLDLEKEEHPELNDEDEEFDDLENEDMEDEEFDDTDIDEDEFEDMDEVDNFQTRKYDFKDKGRPGLYDMDESMNENWDDEDEDDYGDDLSEYEWEVGSALYTRLKDSNIEFDEDNLGDALYDKMGFILRCMKGGLSPLDCALKLMKDKEFMSQIVDEDDFSESFKGNKVNTSRMKAIIENLRARTINEAAEIDDEDELKDEDLDSLDLDNKTPETDDETATTFDDDEEVEKVEITEFIITVDDVDVAIEELANLGVTAERVEVESKEEEVPMDIDEPENDEKPTEGEGEGDEIDVDLDLDKDTSESLRAFIKANYLTEDEEEKSAEEAGTSDELGLGDQGQEATELNDEPTEDEESLDATTEFEENKIKVKAEDWDILKGWLEEKGVDVKEMFGGDIETEEFDNENDAKDTVGSNSEISDDEIDFTGIGDDDKTKIKDEKTEKTNESLNESIIDTEVEMTEMEIDTENLTATLIFDLDGWDDEEAALAQIEAFAEGTHDLIDYDELEHVLFKHGYCIDETKSWEFDEDVFPTVTIYIKPR